MYDKAMMSRRGVLLSAACAMASACVSDRALALPQRRRVAVPLPSSAQIRRDYQTMVDFGPRLPGGANHLRFVAWMAQQFEAAGLTPGPCGSYPYTRWEPKRVGLDIVDGRSRHAVKDVTFFVRSKPTGPAGVRGQLVYGGPITAEGPAPEQTFPSGSIVVFDGTLRTMVRREMTAPHFIHVRGSTHEEMLDERYRRIWTTPAYKLDALADRGVAGVVIIMDLPSSMVADNFSPHSSHYRPKVPALFVGQDVGLALRDAAKAGKSGHLTLDAEWIAGDVPQLTAILPGRTDEVMIIDTHTDGQNFIEENGCMTMIQLARHFASLPEGQRLRRSLVFAGWPGHMSGELPEASGWMRAHPDLTRRAAAAFTIEHLGASEWEDVPGKGYAATGRNEYMNWAVTAGPLTDMTVDGIKRHDLLRHGVQAAPGFTTGSVFHNSGIPHVGCICGTTYLLSIAPNGHMDKLDANLAARQTTMLAELIRKADGLSLADLRGGDATLGAKPVSGPDTSKHTTCRQTA